MPGLDPLPGRQVRREIPRAEDPVDEHRNVENHAAATPSSFTRFHDFLDVGSGTRLSLVTAPPDCRFLHLRTCLGATISSQAASHKGM